MGFFRKKENRIYSLEQALKLLKMPEYTKYTTVPVGNGFKIVPETEQNYNNYQSARRYQNQSYRSLGR